jgi:hypothetical protein
MFAGNDEVTHLMRVVMVAAGWCMFGAAAVLKLGGTLLVHFISKGAYARSHLLNLVWQRPQELLNDLWRAKHCCLCFCILGLVCCCFGLACGLQVCAKPCQRSCLLGNVCSVKHV